MRQGREMRGILWCLWFATLMSAPFAVSVSNLGILALDKGAAWAALGMLAGIWLAAHPTIGRALDKIGPLVVVVGLPVTLVTLAYAWGYLIYNVCFFYGGASTQGFMAHVLLSIVNLYPGMAQRCVLIASSALACGLASRWCLANQQDSRRSATPAEVWPRKIAIAACAFACGVAQPFAWAILLPHKQSLAVSRNGVDALQTFSWCNPQNRPLFWLCMALALLSMLALAYLTTHPHDKGAQGRVSLLPTAALCTGVLGFRVVGRVAPVIYLMMDKLAAIGMVAWLVFLMATICLTLTPQRSAKVTSTCNDAPSKQACPTMVASADRPEKPTSREDLVAALPAQDRAFLLEKGLSAGELAATAASLLCLSGPQTARSMGVSEPTVRSYRGRVREKLGLTSLDDLAALLPSCQPCAADDTPSEQPEPSPSQRRATMASCAALCAMLAMSMLMTLPFGHTLRAWDDVWTTSFGVAFGLIGGLVVRPIAASHKRASLLAAGLVCLGTLLVAALWYQGVIPLRASEVLGKALRIATFTGFVASVNTLLYLLGAHVRAWDAVAPFALVGASLTVPYALARLSSTLWLACAAAADLALLVSLALLARGPWEGAPRDANETCAPQAPEPCGVCWLAAAALFGWMASELWRAQRYTSVLDALTWGVAGLLLLATIRTMPPITRQGIPVCFLPLAFAIIIPTTGGDAATTVIAYGIALGALLACRDASAAPSWHSAPVSTAFGLVAGTLMTNAYGFVEAYYTDPAIDKLLTSSFGMPPIGGNEGLHFVVGTAVSLVVGAVLVACLVAEVRRQASQRDLAQDGELMDYLASLGLLPQQAQMVALLARGYTLGQVALKLSYSESAVRSVRSQAYKALGVRSREELAEALRPHGLRETEI